MAYIKYEKTYINLEKVSAIDFDDELVGKNLKFGIYFFMSEEDSWRFIDFEMPDYLIKRKDEIFRQIVELILSVSSISSLDLIVNTAIAIAKKHLDLQNQTV